MHGLYEVGLPDGSTHLVDRQAVKFHPFWQCRPETLLDPSSDRGMRRLERRLVDVVWTRVRNPKAVGLESWGAATPPGELGRLAFLLCNNFDPARGRSCLGLRHVLPRTRPGARQEQVVPHPARGPRDGQPDLDADPVRRLGRVGRPRRTLAPATLGLRVVPDAEAVRSDPGTLAAPHIQRAPERMPTAELPRGGAAPGGHDCSRRIRKAEIDALAVDEDAEGHRPPPASALASMPAGDLPASSSSACSRWRVQAADGFRRIPAFQANTSTGWRPSTT